MSTLNAQKVKHASAVVDNITLGSDGKATFGGIADLGSIGQLKFPATQNASADANTLDDYEEGTWLPELSGAISAPTLSYNARNGTYIKIGRLVCARFYIALNSRSGGSGASVITNLPFVAENNNHWGSSVSAYGYFTTSGPQSGYIPAFSTNLILVTFASVTSDGPVAITNWGSSTYLYGQVTYMVS